LILPASTKAVLFDLDGTLVDSAPDLIGALERLRVELGLPPIDPAPLRAVASRGAVAMLELGLPEFSPAQAEAFRQRYIDNYAAQCWDRSRVFDGIGECLDRIELLGLRWGVVTNKVEWLARRVVQGAGWNRRAGCLVGGDTTANPKPAPDPVLAACDRLGVRPRDSVFVGDDQRDVLAGQAAGVGTLIAAWGYIPAGSAPERWGAEAIFAKPLDLLAALPERAGATP